MCHKKDKMYEKSPHYDPLSGLMMDRSDIDT